MTLDARMFQEKAYVTGKATVTEPKRLYEVLRVRIPQKSSRTKRQRSLLLEDCHTFVSTSLTEQQLEDGSFQFLRCRKDGIDCSATSAASDSSTVAAA